MATRRNGFPFGSDVLASLDAASSLTRGIGGLSAVGSAVSAHQRLLGGDLLAVMRPTLLERVAMPPPGVLAAARGVVDVGGVAAYSGLARQYQPLAVSALDVFDRPAWRALLAQSERFGRVAESARAAAGLAAAVDATLTLAGRLDELGPRLPPRVLSALDASYSGWTTTIGALPPDPDFAPVWRTRAAGEVPLRLTAAAVALVDDEIDDVFDDESLADYEDEAADAFDLGLGSRLEASLGALHPSLPGRLRAARLALRRDDERAAAQAANELVELVNHAVRLGATDEQVRAWHRGEPDHDPMRTVSLTRELRVRYLASLSPAAAVAQAHVAPLDTMLKFLQQVKHSLDVTPVEPVRLVAPAVEAALALLFGAEPRD